VDRGHVLLDVWGAPRGLRLTHWLLSFICRSTILFSFICPSAIVLWDLPHPSPQLWLLLLQLDDPKALMESLLVVLLKFSSSTSLVRLHVWGMSSTTSWPASLVVGDFSKNCPILLTFVAWPDAFVSVMVVDCRTVESSLAIRAVVEITFIYNHLFQEFLLGPTVSTVLISCCGAVRTGSQNQFSVQPAIRLCLHRRRRKIQIRIRLT
jgi:hypothetical protein